MPELGYKEIKILCRWQLGKESFSEGTKRLRAASLRIIFGEQFHHENLGTYREEAFFRAAA